MTRTHILSTIVVMHSLFGIRLAVKESLHNIGTFAKTTSSRIVVLFGVRAVSRLCILLHVWLSFVCARMCCHRATCVRVEFWRAISTRMNGEWHNT